MIDHDFTLGVTGFDVIQRRLGICECEGAIDRHLDLVGLHQLSKRLELLAAGFD